MMRHHPLATISLIAATVVGVAIGVIGERLWLTHRTSEPMTQAALIAEMDRRLHLDAAQRHAVAEILNRHQAAVDSSWAVVQLRVRAAIDSSQREVLAILRPEQRGPYLTWMTAAHRGVESGGGLGPPEGHL